MDGTQVRSARNYTQIEDALDLERERLRFEEEKIFATKLYTGMGLSEKVSLSLFTHGIFLASQVVTATDNELRMAGVPATSHGHIHCRLLRSRCESGQRDLQYHSSYQSHQQ